MQFWGGGGGGGGLHHLIILYSPLHNTMRYSEMFTTSLVAAVHKVKDQHTNISSILRLCSVM